MLKPETDKPIIIFSRTICPKCKFTKFQLKSLCKEYYHAYEDLVLEINLDEQPEYEPFAQSYNVMSAPLVVLNDESDFQNHWFGHEQDKVKQAALTFMNKA